MPVVSFSSPLGLDGFQSAWKASFCVEFNPSKPEPKKEKKKVAQEEQRKVPPPPPKSTRQLFLVPRQFSDLRRWPKEIDAIGDLVVYTSGTIWRIPADSKYAKAVVILPFAADRFSKKVELCLRRVLDSLESEGTLVVLPGCVGFPTWQEVIREAERQVRSFAGSRVLSLLPPEGRSTRSIDCLEGCLGRQPLVLEGDELSTNQVRVFLRLASTLVPEFSLLDKILTRKRIGCSGRPAISSTRGHVGPATSRRRF